MVEAPLLTSHFRGEAPVFFQDHISEPLCACVMSVGEPWRLGVTLNTDPRSGHFIITTSYILISVIIWKTESANLYWWVKLTKETVKTYFIFSHQPIPQPLYSLSGSIVWILQHQSEYQLCLEQYTHTQTDQWMFLKVLDKTGETGAHGNHRKPFDVLTPQCGHFRVVHLQGIEAGLGPKSSMFLRFQMLDISSFSLTHACQHLYHRI